MDIKDKPILPTEWVDLTRGQQKQEMQKNKSQDHPRSQVLTWVANDVFKMIGP